MVAELLSPQEIAQRRKNGLELQAGENRNELPETNVALLSTFNLQLFPPFLVDALDRVGLYASVHLGQFGQLYQEVLDENSGLYQSNPEEVVIVPAFEDLLSPLYEGPGIHSQDQLDELIKTRIDQLIELVGAVLERLPSATCYIVVCGTDRVPMPHILHPRDHRRGPLALEQLGREIRSLGDLSPRVVIVDWDWHTRANGAASYRDERLWYLARMRLNPHGLAALAELVAQHVAAYRGHARKVVVVDLDNTLWGGIVGEDGLQGLTLGEEGLGLAFQDFQRELLKLYDTGIVLAICSKNNPDEAWEVFDHHSGMVIQREHFAALRVNWQDKATNLIELSEELSLGLDSFVFLDDSPVEREWVRSALPEVLVPDLPDDAAFRPQFLRHSPFFQRTTLTEADIIRSESYKGLGLRRQLREKVGTFEEFLASLKQEITIEPVHEGSIARASQMCQRTNQFNLTTRRYTTADLEQMKHDPAMEVHTLKVSDRFGDSGITGLGVLKFELEDANIDTLLLSCRILGRKVEDVFLAFLAERGRAHGARFLIGHYTATAKNGQVALFYLDRGFERISESLFRLNLEDKQLDVQPQITIEAAPNA